MIPKIIHQIWVGKFEIPIREQESVKELKLKHSDYHHFFWNDDNLPEIPDHIKNTYQIFYEKKQYVVCADILRWLVVYQHGGWYLDVDWECISNLNNIDVENKDGIVFGHWGTGWKHCDYTIANNVFAFKENNMLVKYIIENMNNGGYYYPSWCGLIVKKYFGLKNDFSKEIDEYHKVMREKLDSIKIEYGDYNVFQNTILKHNALYSWKK